MNLLDRYLQAVRKHLPWQRQDDILAELRANLESQLEDKESELGRPLTKDEAEAWLKQIGPPIQVAARYQPQQYLIGPSLFPIYWYVLRLASLLALVVYTVVHAALVFSGVITDWHQLLGAVLGLPGVLLSTVMWITFVFAIIEFAITRYGTSWLPANKFPPSAGFGPNWTPGDLPPLEKKAAEKTSRSYAHAVADVVFGFLVIIWLLLVPQHPVLMFGPGIHYYHLVPYQFAPVWMTFYWWCIALNIVQYLWKLYDLISGRWQKPHSAQLIFVKAVSLIPMAILLNVKDHILFTLKQPATDAARYGGTLDLINRSTRQGLWCVFAIVLIQLLVEIGIRLKNNYRDKAAATH